jgi:hypothetical protein
MLAGWSGLREIEIIDHMDHMPTSAIDVVVQSLAARIDRLWGFGF